jgi:hypothetical protein
MNEKVLINRLASNAADIEDNDHRLEALELAVSWLLAQQPNDAGSRFLALQANVLEETGKAPDVVAGLDNLRELVGALRVLRESDQDVQQKNMQA